MLNNRNITVNGHRTSIRLEPEFWTGLADIAQREHLTIDQLCSEVGEYSGGLHALSITARSTSLHN